MDEDEEFEFPADVSKLDSPAADTRIVDKQRVGVETGPGMDWLEPKGGTVGDPATRMDKEPQNKVIHFLKRAAQVAGAMCLGLFGVDAVRTVQNNDAAFGHIHGVDREGKEAWKERNTALASLKTRKIRSSSLVKDVSEALKPTALN